MGCRVRRPRPAPEVARGRWTRDWFASVGFMSLSSIGYSGAHLNGAFPGRSGTACPPVAGQTRSSPRECGRCAPSRRIPLRGNCRPEATSPLARSSSSHAGQGWNAGYRNYRDCRVVSCPASPSQYVSRYCRDISITILSPVINIRCKHCLPQPTPPPRSHRTYPPARYGVFPRIGCRFFQPTARTPGQRAAAGASPPCPEWTSHAAAW